VLTIYPLSEYTALTKYDNKTTDLPEMCNKKLKQWISKSHRVVSIKRQITPPPKNISKAYNNNNNNDRLTAFDPGQPG